MAESDEDRNDPPKNLSTGNALLAALAIGTLVTWVYVIGTVIFKSPADLQVKTSPSASSQSGIGDEPISAWSYSRYPDKVRGGFTDKACKRSKEKVYLEWPYEPVYAVICLRVNSNKSKDVYVELMGNGQIMCNSYDGCRLPVRLGDLGKPKFYSGVGPSDGSSNIVFLTPSGKLFDNLKNGTKAIVEIEFYQAGRQQIEFDTTGLESGRL